MQERNAGEKCKVLLVEDDKFLRDIFEKKTKDTFELMSTSTAEKFLVMADEQIPEVILLDLGLPDGSGFELLKKIRENEKLKDALVLILTNSVMSEDAIRSNELKADDFLIKANISIEEVVERIKKHVSEKHAHISL